MPLIDFEKKFRSEGLEKLDEPQLLKEIVATRSPAKLLSYLYIYGYSFGENEQVSQICDYYVKNPTPGLTAVCMRVLIEDWNQFDRYYGVLEHFLNFDLFDDWYDEIIFAVNFVNRNKTISFPSAITNKFAKIIAEPQISSLEIFR